MFEALSPLHQFTPLIRGVERRNSFQHIDITGLACDLVCSPVCRLALDIAVCNAPAFVATLRFPHRRHTEVFAAEDAVHAAEVIHGDVLAIYQNNLDLKDLIRGI